MRNDLERHGSDTDPPTATELDFSNSGYRNIVQIIFMWVQPVDIHV